MALNTNAIFTVATFFILWVAFRFASKMREGESTMEGKVLTTVFGLMSIWSGLLVGASRNLSFISAANGLKAIKASGQTLSAQAEAFLTIPQISLATANAQFSLFSDTVNLIFWLVVTMLLLSVIWMPVSAKKPT